MLEAEWLEGFRLSEGFGLSSNYIHPGVLFFFFLGLYDWVRAEDSGNLGAASNRRGRNDQNKFYLRDTVRALSYRGLQTSCRTQSGGGYVTVEVY